MEVKKPKGSYCSPAKYDKFWTKFTDMKVENSREVPLVSIWE